VVVEDIVIPVVVELEVIELHFLVEQKLQLKVEHHIQLQ
jgi:hypothetical protein